MQVNISGNTYNVIKKGKGVPCVVIGIATLFERTISKDLYDIFEFIFSDLYWDKKNNLADIKNISMDKIVEDIREMISQLKIKKPLLLAHSAYGIVALEFAKKHQNLLSGIVMIGTPVNSNRKVVEQNEKIFMQEADTLRKNIDKQRRKRVQAENLDYKSLNERFIREYCYMSSARYWHYPEYDCSHLWQGIELTSLFDKFFVEILPRVDVTKNLGKITIPIFHAVGMSDYDCCPWLWKNVENLPEKMVNSYFYKSGHWPHFEEEIEFNKRFICWIKSQI